MRQTDTVQRARRHNRFFSALAFGLLALVAELAGRSLAHRLDVGRHVRSPSYSGRRLLPVPARGGEARRSAPAGRGSSGGSCAPGRRRGPVAACSRRSARARARRRASGSSSRRGSGSRRSPSPRPSRSSTSTPSRPPPAAGRCSGRGLHTSALPVFAVLSVIVALAWSAVSRWLNEYERYAQETCARAGSALGRRPAAAPATPRTGAVLPPRKLFGLAFECRPPAAARLARGTPRSPAGRPGVGNCIGRWD